MLSNTIVENTWQYLPICLCLS